MMHKILKFEIAIVSITWGVINTGSVKNILKDVRVPATVYPA